MANAWVHKWMNSSRTMVLFSNMNNASNVIYSVADLRKALEDKNRPVYNQVPLAVIEKVMRERSAKPLKQSFKSAISM